METNRAPSGCILSQWAAFLESHSRPRIKMIYHFDSGSVWELPWGRIGPSSGTILDPTGVAFAELHFELRVKMIVISIRSSVSLGPHWNPIGLARAPSWDGSGHNLVAWLAEDPGGNAPKGAPKGPPKGPPKSTTKEHRKVTGRQPKSHHMEGDARLSIFLSF